MTTTPKQRAEELARECAFNIDTVQQCQGVQQMHKLQGVIQQTIPLEIYEEAIGALRQQCKCQSYIILKEKATIMIECDGCKLLSRYDAFQKGRGE